MKKRRKAGAGRKKTPDNDPIYLDQAVGCALLSVPEFRAKAGLPDQAPDTLETIGACMGISRERVRHIEEAAFTKIRDQVSPDLLTEIFELLNEKHLPKK